MIWQWVRIWLLISLAVLLAALRLEPSPTAAETINHAGLVVRDGAGRLTYAWLLFAQDKFNGLSVLKATDFLPLTMCSRGCRDRKTGLRLRGVTLWFCPERTQLLACCAERMVAASCFSPAVDGEIEMRQFVQHDARGAMPRQRP